MAFRLVPFLVSWQRFVRIGVPFLVSSCSSMRPASRQAIRSRFARASRSSARRASRPAVRFPVLFIVPRCFALLGSSSLVSCSRLVCSSRQAVRILSFRLAARGVGSWCRVAFLRLVLFCSCLISLVASHGHGGGSSFVVSFRSSSGCVFLSLLSSVIVGRGDGGVSVPFDDTKDAPFSSARFLIG